MFDAFFDSWGHWAWVTFAWVQLLVTYGGYQLYLRRRQKRLEARLSKG
jgi:hypothetical protein